MGDIGVVEIGSFLGVLILFTLSVSTFVIKLIVFRGEQQDKALTSALKIAQIERKVTYVEEKITESLDAVAILSKTVDAMVSVCKKNNEAISDMLIVSRESQVEYSKVVDRLATVISSTLNRESK